MINQVMAGLEKIFNLITQPVSYNPPDMKLFMKSAEFQFKMIGPRWGPVLESEKKGLFRRCEKAGVVLIEATRADKSRPGFMDWKNKVNFALSDKDISAICVGFRSGNEPFSLVHKNQQTGAMKSLEFGDKKLGRLANPRGQVPMTLGEKREDGYHSVTFYLGRQDAHQLTTFLTAAVPHLYGFNRL